LDNQVKYGPFVLVLYKGICNNSNTGRIQYKHFYITMADYNLSLSPL